MSHMRPITYSREAVEEAMQEATRVAQSSIEDNRGGKEAASRNLIRGNRDRRVA